MTVKTYRDLIAWQKSMELVKAIYQASAKWPNSEMYGLISQIRRASVSIPSNIAEGHGRRATKDYLRYLDMAYASLMESETQLRIAEMLGYLPLPHLEHLISQTEELGRILNGLIRSLDNVQLQPKASQ